MVKSFLDEMGDSLDDLDLPSTGETAITTKPEPAKSGALDFFKFIGISAGAFVVIGNPYTALALSKISFLNTPMKIFGVQALMYLLVVAGAKWYLK